ncbi:MAG: transposase, partial [Deltaproteobacteria bacterium]|nr:transposase [Deltaproteobacteria bacterium]
SIWERVKSWFGFKLHLMVDADYELPVGYEVTKASVADTPLPISLEIGFQGWHSLSFGSYRNMGV